MLEESLAEYIFLSREIPLPLTILQQIKTNGITFNEVINLSEDRFKSFLEDMNRNYKIHVRKMEDKIYNFTKKKNERIFSKIQDQINICKEHNIKCLSYFDKNFPYLLKLIKPPPKLIFIRGELKKEDEKAVAIIGTRTPTKYGEKMAYGIAKKLTEYNFTIISGFARGIDTIAVESALDNGGRAIGVIASGLLNIYPKENKGLAKRMELDGALLSEKFPLKSVDKRALQIRNRITSGLALGNIFVEGKRDSGTKWQLKFGKNQGRPSIAVKPIGNYEQAHVPNIIINEEHGEIISTLDDVDYIAEILLNEFEARRRNKRGQVKGIYRQANLFKFYDH